MILKLQRPEISVVLRSRTSVSTEHPEAKADAVTLSYPPPIATTILPALVRLTFC